MALCTKAACRQHGQSACPRPQCAAPPKKPKLETLMEWLTGHGQPIPRLTELPRPNKRNQSAAQNAAVLVVERSQAQIPNFRKFVTCSFGQGLLGELIVSV